MVDISANDVIRALNKNPMGLSKISASLKCDAIFIKKLCSMLVDIGFIKKENSKYQLTIIGSKHLETLPEPTRTYKCRVCGRYLPSNAFHLNRNKSRGLQSECKECRSKMRRVKRDDTSPESFPGGNYNQPENNTPQVAVLLTELIDLQKRQYLLFEKLASQGHKS